MRDINQRIRGQNIDSIESELLRQSLREARLVTSDLDGKTIEIHVQKSSKGCQRCFNNGVVFYNPDGGNQINGATITIPCLACRPDDYEKWLEARKGL